jgi:hypothetical protein
MSMRRRRRSRIKTDVVLFVASSKKCNIPDIKSMQNINKMLEMAE